MEDNVITARVLPEGMVSYAHDEEFATKMFRYLIKMHADLDGDIIHILIRDRLMYKFPIISTDQIILGKDSELNDRIFFGKLNDYLDQISPPLVQYKVIIDSSKKIIMICDESLWYKWYQIIMVVGCPTTIIIFFT